MNTTVFTRIQDVWTKSSDRHYNAIWCLRKNTKSCKSQFNSRIGINIKLCDVINIQTDKQNYLSNCEKGLTLELFFHKKNDILIFYFSNEWAWEFIVEKHQRQKFTFYFDRLSDENTFHGYFLAHFWMIC